MRGATTLSAIFAVLVAAGFRADGAQPRNVNTSSLSATGAGFIVSPDSAGIAGVKLYTGWSIAVVDWDGDGKKDLVISATSGNKVYVMFGPIKGEVVLPPANTSQGFIVTSAPTPGGSFGCSVAGGDLNGDGLDDVVISSGTAQGFAAIVWGRRLRDVSSIDASQLSGSGRGVVISGRGVDYFASSVRIVPSVNGDQFNDLLVGAPGYAGATYVIFGGNGTWTSGSLFNTSLPSGWATVVGDPTKNNAGTDVAGCRDINGDRIGDFVFSSTSKTVYAVFGRTDGRWPSKVTELDGSNGFVVACADITYYGNSVDCGDINGDGFSDLIVGTSVEGIITVMFGHNGTWQKSVNANSTNLGGERGFIARGIGYAGKSVRIVGDVNGDRIDDLGIGAPYLSGTSYRGTTYVLYGHRSPWSPFIDLDTLDPATTGFIVQETSELDHARFPLSNNPGNIDGDPRGLSDVVFGAPGYNSSTGRAVVVFALNCKTRDSYSGGCTTCFSGDLIVNDTCVGCSTVPNMFIDSAGNCQSCVIGNCLECTVNGVCTVCGSGFVPSGVDMSCTFIPVTSVVIGFDPAIAVTTSGLAAEIATAIGVPVQLVTVTFVNNGEVLVTISGSNAISKADELISIVNSQQCNQN